MQEKEWSTASLLLKRTVLCTLGRSRSQSPQGNKRVIHLLAKLEPKLEDSFTDPSYRKISTRRACIRYTSATYLPFTEFAFSSAVGYMITKRLLEWPRDMSDHIMFTLTSHERYKEMKPSSSPSIVEVSLAPEAAVPVTPEFA